MAKTCLQLIPNQLDLLITDITACVCYSMQLAMCRDLIHNSLCIPQCPVMRYETVKPLCCWFSFGATTGNTDDDRNYVNEL